MNRMDGNGTNGLRYRGAMLCMLTTNRPLMPSEKHLCCAVCCAVLAVHISGRKGGMAMRD